MYTCGQRHDESFTVLLILVVGVEGRHYLHTASMSKTGISTTIPKNS
eukprot:SAG31_NODE_1556_length_7893_cov_1.993585_11_plen_46_part_01